MFLSYYDTIGLFSTNGDDVSLISTDFNSSFTKLAIEVNIVT